MKDQSEGSRDPGRSYDEIPYVMGVVPGAHPDALAVVGTRHGMTPPPVETSRVLELGCGAGHNLVAIAVALPGARLVGIDASSRQVGMGEALRTELGLANLELHCCRLEDFAAPPGSFDYVLCHGVYSWVPPPAQERIFALSRTLLSPQGLAYVSYNTLPGWHLRGRLREMLHFHIEGEERPSDRLAQARAFLRFLVLALDDRSDDYARMLRNEAEELRGESDAYLYHELLEDDNAPEYFHEFVARAATHGLRYVDEARPLTRASLPAEAVAALAEAGPDRIATEQYLDFLSGRTFRRTVLCHEAVPVAHAPDRPETVTRLRLGCAARPERWPEDLLDDSPLELRGSRHGVLTTNQPLLKTALAELSDAYPASVPFAELLRTVRGRFRERGLDAPEDDAGALAMQAARCHRFGLLELRTWEPGFTLDPGERPRASPLSRLEVARDSAVVTSLRHTPVGLDPFQRGVLALLDGALDRRQLCDRLRAGDPAVSEEDVEGAIRFLASRALVME